MPTGRRPSNPFLHMATPSSSTLNSELRPSSTYASSIYAQSTLAASTIMPNFAIQPMNNSAVTQCVEGHLLQFINAEDDLSVCSICDEMGSDSDRMVRCGGCSLVCHLRCSTEVSVVCPHAFRPDQIRAAFVRCFASLLHTYRKFLCFADPRQRKNGLLYSFNQEAFVKSVPSDTQEYLSMLLRTQSMFK